MYWKSLDIDRRSTIPVSHHNSNQISILILDEISHQILVWLRFVLYLYTKRFLIPYLFESHIGTNDRTCIMIFLWRYDEGEGAGAGDPRLG